MWIIGNEREVWIDKSIVNEEHLWIDERIGPGVEFWVVMFAGYGELLRIELIVSNAYELWIG